MFTHSTGHPVTHVYNQGIRHIFTALALGKRVNLILKVHSVRNAVLRRPRSSSGTSHHGAWEAGKYPGRVPPGCNALPAGLLPGQTCRYWNPAAAFNLLPSSCSESRSQSEFLPVFFSTSSRRRAAVPALPPAHCAQTHPCSLRYVSLRGRGVQVSVCLFHAPFSLHSGCKVEPFFLNIEAVNTHRERPLVSSCRFTCWVSWWVVPFWQLWGLRRTAIFGNKCVCCWQLIPVCLKLDSLNVLEKD